MTGRERVRQAMSMSGDHIQACVRLCTCHRWVSGESQWGSIHHPQMERDLICISPSTSLEALESYMSLELYEVMIYWPQWKFHSTVLKSGGVVAGGRRPWHSSPESRIWDLRLLRDIHVILACDLTCRPGPVGRVRYSQDTESSSHSTVLIACYPLWTETLGLLHRDSFN